MNELFNWCVKLLELMAQEFGTTYELVNVWIFCIIEPIVFLGMLIFILFQRRKIKRLKMMLDANHKPKNNSNFF
jgi:hypothetical protein